MKPSPTCEGYRTFWGGITPTIGFTVLGQEKMRDSIQKQAKQQAGFLTKHPGPAPTSSVTTVAVSALSGSRSSLSTGSPDSGSKVLGVGKIMVSGGHFCSDCPLLGKSPGIPGQLREKEEIVFDIICDLEGPI